MKISGQKILAYALENALLHSGTAKAGAVLPKLFLEGLKKEQIKNVMPSIQQAIKNVNSMSLEEQKNRFEKLKDLVKERKHEEKVGLPELEKAEQGKVILRHAPYPSGPLHIGNAVPAIINDEYSKKYSGKVYLIIDDTIGSEEKQIIPEAYKLIPQGLDWLDAEYEKEIIYRSDRLNIYYKYAEELIKKGKAYVCFCSAERLRKNRASGKECECRQKDIESNIKDWRWMFSSDAKAGSASLRIKTSLQHPNPAFRDRVLFRISERIHPRVKGFKVWPLLEFSAAIDDHLLNITHIIRGKQLIMESEMQELIWSIFNWQKPVFAYTPLVTFEGVKISKSESQKEIKKGIYKGWDDPRTWSLQSLEKRGIQPAALRKLIISFGMTGKENITIPIDMLYAENKKLIESASRYFFIENPVKIKIEKAKKMKVKIPLHPQDLKRGYREFSAGPHYYISKQDFDSLEEGKIYRLMNLFNFKKEKGKFIFHSKKIEQGLHAGMIHWLPALKTLPKIKVLMPFGEYKEGIAEKAVKKLKISTIVQFERMFFARKTEKGEFWFTHHY